MMIAQRYMLACVMTALLGFVVTGCKLPKSVSDLGGGYEEVTHPKRNFNASSEPLPPRVSLEYRGTNDTDTPIWPALYGVGEVINSNIAIFVGEKAYTDPDPATLPRVFAVKAPELPLDITDEVLREWSAATRRNFKTAQERLSLITPEDEDGNLALHLEFGSSEAELSTRDAWPSRSTLRLTWDQVDDIMKTVKAGGIRKKDIRWGTPYISAKP